MNVVELNCPGCGARVSTSQKICEWCHQPIVITSFNTLDSMTIQQVNKYAGTYAKILKENPDNQEINISAGLCFLKLKLYDKALASLEKAMPDNFDNSDVFFYAAIAVLAGKKPFVHLRPEIDKMEEYLKAAMMIEDKGIYHYFRAYIKHDYFQRKYFKTSPTWEEELANAEIAGCTETDINNLFATIGIQRPNIL